MSTQDGGPAFSHDGQANYTGGLSMRDWFAGQALAGILSIPTSNHDPLGDARVKAMLELERDER